MHSRKLIVAALAFTVAGIACNGPRSRADKPGTSPERGRDAAGDSAAGIGTGGFSGPGGGGSGGTLDADGPNMDASDPDDRPPGSDGSSLMDAVPTPDDGNADGAIATGPVCGNGVVESGEECDPPGSCPTGCPNRGCTRFALQGEASRCTARCVEMSPQVACQGGDGCCPPTCNATNDGDCAIKCDNGVKEGQETCDPLSSCPSGCPPSGCQLRKLVNPGTCGAACVNDRQQTTCTSGDGCCPSSCNSLNDSECPASCGNGVVENGENCDPVSQCNSRRDACTSNRDTVRTRSGDPSTCAFRCMEAPRACGPDDGQCPSGCAAGQDPDCKRPNGETCGVGGECVSGNCVSGVCCNTACDDGCRSCRLPEKVGTCSAPNSTETCGDGSDNNCDGRIDENCCGGSNQVCCPSGANQGCQSGFICRNGTCTPCGSAELQICCSEGRPCRRNDLICGTVGQRSECYHCGASDQACCGPERTTDLGLAPSSGTCDPGLRCRAVTDGPMILGFECSS
jgi:hypothetical protein